MPTDQYELMNSKPVQTAEEIARANLKKAKRAEEAKAAQEQAAKDREAEIRQKQEGLRIQAQKEADERAKEPKYQGRLNKPKPNWVTIDGKRIPLQKAIEDIPRQYEEADRKKAEQDAADQRIHASPLMAKALRRARTEHLMEKEGMTPQDAEALARKEQLERRLAFEHGQKSMDAMPDSFAKEARMFGVEMGGALLAPVMRMTGNDHAADQYEASKAGMQSGMDEHRELFYPYPETQAAFSGAVQSLGQMAPGAIAGAMGQPGVGMAIMAGQFGSQEYSRALYEGAEAGLSGADLNQYATLQGGIEAAVMPVFNAIPGLGGLEARLLRQTLARSVAQNPTIRKALVQGAKKLTFETASELLEEITTEALHGLVDQKKLGKDVDFWKITKDTSLQTLITMGLVNLGSAAGKLFEKKQQAQPDVNLEEPTPPPQDPARAQAEAEAAMSRFPDLQELAKNNPEKLPELAAEALRRVSPEAEQAPAQSQQPGTPAQSQAPGFQLAPEIMEFISKPSATNYEAAVKAGMKAIGTANRQGRSFLAKYLRDQLSRIQPQQPAAQDPAMLEPQQEALAPEAVSGGDSEVDDVVQSLLKGLSHDQEGNVQRQQEVQQEQSQGYQEGQRQEGLLAPEGTPAGTQEAEAQPAEPRDSATPAAHTEADAKAAFQKAYEENFQQWKKYSDGEDGFTQYAQILSDMHDQHPDWAEELHNSEASPVFAPGMTSPEQPTPSTAVPVSSKSWRVDAVKRLKEHDWNSDFRGRRSEEYLNAKQQGPEALKEFLNGGSANTAFAEAQHHDMHRRGEQIRAMIAWGDAKMTEHLKQGKSFGFVPDLPYPQERGRKPALNSIKPGQIVSIGYADGSEALARLETKDGKKQSFRILTQASGQTDMTRPGHLFHLHADQNNILLGMAKDKEVEALNPPPLGASKAEWQDYEYKTYKKPGKETAAEPVSDLRKHFEQFSETNLPKRADLEILKQALAKKNEQVDAMLKAWKDSKGLKPDTKAMPSKLGNIARDVWDPGIIDATAGKALEAIEKKYKRADPARLMNFVRKALDSLDVDLNSDQYKPIVDPEMPDTESGVDSQGRRFTNKHTVDGVEVQLVYTKGDATYETEKTDKGTLLKETGRVGASPDYWIAKTPLGNSEIGDSLQEALDKAKAKDKQLLADRDDNANRTWTREELSSMRPKYRVREIAKVRGVADSQTKQFKTLVKEIIEKQSAPKQSSTEPQKPAAKDPAAGPITEPPKRKGFVRVYHSGSVGDGDDISKRWVSTDRAYASGYRPHLPLFFLDLPADDPRVNNPDFPENNTERGFTFNFELNPEESARLQEIHRDTDKQPQTPAAKAAAERDKAAEAASDKPVGWRREAGEDRGSYHTRLKQQGWTKSPKPSVTVLDSPDRVLDLSIQQLKDKPFKAGDKVTLHTGFSGDDMQIDAEIVEDSKPGESHVKVRTKEGRVHSSSAYYVTPDAVAPAAAEPAAQPSLIDMLKAVNEKLDEQGRFPDDRLLKRKDELEKLISEETANEAAEAAEKPETTVRGQRLLSGMPGRAEEIDQSEFIDKHRSKLLDDVSAVAEDEATSEELFAPMGKILKAIWTGQLESPKDQFDDEYGNEMWVEIEAAIAKHESRYMHGMLEEMADMALRRAFIDRAKIFPSSEAGKKEAAKPRAKVQDEILKHLLPEDPHDNDGWQRVDPEYPMEAMVAIGDRPAWPMRVDAYNPERDEVLLTHEARRKTIFVSRASLEDVVDQKPEGKRHPSAVLKYPALIPDPYKSGREFDAPPVYLTGVSNEATRAAAKNMPNLGVVVQPNTAQYVSHLSDYSFIGIDNGAFTSKPNAEFREDKFYSMLDEIREAGHAGKVIYAVAPDVVGDWEATLEKSGPHFDRIRDAGFPVAVALQNGAEVETVPWSKVDVLFVGGDDNFKLAQTDSSGKLDHRSELLPILFEAKRRGVPVHFGRVNSMKRLEIVHYGMRASSVDGTFVKFGEPDKHTETVLSWLRPWGEFPSEMTPEDLKLEAWWDGLKDNERGAIIRMTGLMQPNKVKWRALKATAREKILEFKPDDEPTTDADRLEAIKDGRFAVGDRVADKVTGETGALTAIDEASGLAEVKFDNGSTGVGINLSGYERVAAPNLDDAAAAEWDRQEAEEAAKKKKPRAPKTPKAEGETTEKKQRKKRTSLGEKLGEKSKKTGAASKKSFDDMMQAFREDNLLSLLPGAPPPLSQKSLMATVRFARDMVQDQVVKFADFVVAFIEATSPALALKVSDYLEAAWRVAGKRVPGLDEAGKVSDVVKEWERAQNANRPGDQAPERPVGSDGMEETAPDDVPEDAGGGDAGGSSDAGGGRSDGTTSGASEIGDEGSGSVSAGKAGNDRPSGQRGRLNFRITAEDRIGTKFNSRERFEKNVEAIRLLKQIESENRMATADEQKVLAQYVGWGGLKEAFSTREDQGLREKAILKDLLTEDELASARTSVRNAHYTSPEVISAMWEGLIRAGFTGGRILEPSIGIGHFYGLIPQNVAAVSKLAGIEMDSISARIATQLYQAADIKHAMYQDVNVKPLQDIVISNVPFGSYKIGDKHDKALKKKESVHNFFFLKALKNVRPGGVVAFITSRYTMDTMDPSIREKLEAAGGRFIGAVRLPNNAFMGIAKTKVTTDVIFIQKDAGDGQRWRNVKESAAGFVFNEYFHEHPEHVLGTFDPKGGTQIGEWGIAPNGHDIGAELEKLIAAMPFDRSALAENSTEGESESDVTPDDGVNADVPDGQLTIRDGKLFKAVDGQLEPVPLWGGERGQERKFEIIRAMGKLAASRDKLSALETSPIATDAEIERARKNLNKEYDAFVKEHGFIHKPENQGLFRPDEQLPTLLALEEWDTDTKTAKKADVFEKRVQRPSDADSVPTTAEGAAVESYARLGRIDLDAISSWLKKPVSQVEDELSGWAYKDPASGEWFLKNVYLSGNIAKKLKSAEAAAKENPAYQRNVDALKAVLPPRKTAGEIHVRPRSPFITAQQYKGFLNHLGMDANIQHEQFSGAWLIDSPRTVDTVAAGRWTVGQKNPADLLTGLLNNKPPVVYKTDYDGTRVVDDGATQLARAKAKEIEEEFGRWVFNDPERTKAIEDAFNETVGAFIEGDWDGSHLKLPGMNINITLLPHQLNAVWRAIVTGNILLAHEVGLGKTFIMSAIAMERRRLGLATNQMFVVPNHLLAQWASEFKALYPSAKLLALESDQINATNRRTLMERVKSGRFDAIIVTPEAYKKMPMSKDVVAAKLRDITAEIEDRIKEARKAKGDNKNFVAKLEAVLESIRTKMQVMLNQDAKDAGANFDDLNIDAIYVDEAHEYRNLWSMTQMGDISGVGLDGNQKTFDMLLKTDYLNAKTNGRGIVFATGTPIANSISELYSMQRYLQPKTLEEAGVATFDDWANTFGEAVTDIEVDPTGSGFRSKTRFKEFRNTIALSKIFRQVADVKYAEDVGLDKVRPKLRGGKLHAIQVMPSRGLLAYVRNLVTRLEISKRRSFDKRIDNPLKVTTDGRKAALDMRLVVPEDDGISSKINIAVENVARIYREEDERKGAQLMWVNLGTPASKGKKRAPAAVDPDADPAAARMSDDEDNMESGRINAYEDIKRKLVAQGIPENEIAFIHDYTDKDRKRALFQKVREGKVRILISTVKKLATGANIQTRLAAMHFLDPPWKPADIEQALGRAIRRGNLYQKWGDVQGFTYVTRGSFDAYIWQLLENKAKAIKQIMRGEADSVEDTGRIELNADEVKALASSNPRVLELVKVRNEAGQLMTEAAGFRREMANVQSSIADVKWRIESNKQLIKQSEQALKAMPSRDDLHAKFEVTVGKETYSKRSEIGKAILDAIINVMPPLDMKDKAKREEQLKEISSNPIQIGSVLGKKLFIGRSAFTSDPRIIIGQKDGDWFEPSGDEAGTGVRLFNYFDKKYDEPEIYRKQLAQREQELESLKQRAEEKWPKEDQLRRLQETLSKLESELGRSAGSQMHLPTVSDLTKFAIMSQMLGDKLGRPVTFQGTQWMYGDRTPVPDGSVTAEMEREVDNEVLQMLTDAKEEPVEGFFFRYRPSTRRKQVHGRSAQEAREYLRELQKQNRKQIDIIKREWSDIINTAPSGMPLSSEMVRAIANLVVGKIRAGVTSFEIFVKELRTDLNDEIVNGIRPGLIETWNGPIRKKYGTEEATADQFQTAMAAPIEEREAEAVVEQTVQQAQARDRAGVPDGLHSTMNAFTDRDRAVLGMGPRVPRPPQPREASIELAAQWGQTEDGRAEISALLTELEVSPRATTAFENDLLNFRKTQLMNIYMGSKAQQVAAQRENDDTAAAVQGTIAHTAVTELARIIEVLSTGVSYFLGSGLQARKALINTDYTMARSLLEFEAANGYRPDPSSAEYKQMEQQIADLDAAKAALEKYIEELEAKNQDLEQQLEEAYAEAHREATQPEKQKSLKERLEESAKAQLDRAWKKLGAMKQKSYSVEGAAADAMDILKDLASAYVKLGVVQLADFLDRVRKRMGPDADEFGDMLVQAFNSVTSRTPDEQELDDITSRIDPMDEDTIRRAAKKLLGFVIRRDRLDASEQSRERAVDAVQAILNDALEPFEMEISRDHTIDAISGIGVYSEPSQEQDEITRRDIQGQLLIMARTRRWQNDEAPPPTGVRRDQASDIQRALRRVEAEAKKNSNVTTPVSEGRLRSALDAAKRGAENRIRDLDKAIKSNTPIQRSKSVAPTDDVLDALRARRDELQKQYDETFGRPELSEEQLVARATKMLEKEIAQLTKDLDEGRLYRDKKENRPLPRNDELDALRARLAELEAKRDELRVTSGQAQERDDAAFIRRLREQDAKLARRIADNDYARKPKKERTLTNEMLNLMRNVEVKRKVIDDARKEQDFKNMHIVYRTMMRGPVAGAHVLRKMMTTFDASLIGRQGYLLGLTHPVIYGKAIKNAFASTPVKSLTIFPTEEDLFRVQAILDSDPQWVRMEKIGKLAVTDVHGGVNREEGNQWAPEKLNKLWGVGGSERSASAFINTQRRLVFRSLVEKLAKTEDGKLRRMTNSELRVIGNLVNVASGRGSLGKFANSVEALSLVFFSPRWWMSRLAWWAGQPIWHDSRWFGGEGASMEVRKLAAIEWGKQAVAQAAVMGLVIGVLKAALGAPGEDEEWDFHLDPRSPKFGQIRISKTYIDMTAGLGQHLSFFSRLLSGKEVRRWSTEDVDRLGLIGRFERGKLAPIPAAIVDYFAGKSIGGDEFGSLSWFLRKGAPLTGQEAYMSNKVEGPILGPIFSTLAFFGITAQSQDERVKERKDVGNALRAMKKQGKPQAEIDEVLKEHLKESALSDARQKLRTALPEEVNALQAVIDEEPDALSTAIEKERDDIALAASERLASESKDGKSPENDPSITVSRGLLLTIAPTYEEADSMFTAAYKRRFGSVTEKVGTKYVTKESVKEARRRLKALYKK